MADTAFPVLSVDIPGSAEAIRMDSCMFQNGSPYLEDAVHQYDDLCAVLSSHFS